MIPRCESFGMEFITPMPPTNLFLSKYLQEPFLILLFL
ncbi:hypothetical protein NC652_014218 [Populus alba x Populus x berolinensis]|uniref:Uncharacterized protein n=1 Tax=Populus alba x Populus x berolinensis TaxID=444605 RepID=A0AAD6QWH5_9ROSI|nr:hypothetical protein NC652_014218 [Populus alba x Populus x berolinensis]KAJ6997872.1 hypothetical protein NC653_014185 [Populus alba x Populus x berolinensis]